MLAKVTAGEKRTGAAIRNEQATIDQWRRADLAVTTVALFKAGRSNKGYSSTLNLFCESIA